MSTKNTIYYALRHKPTGKLLSVCTETHAWSDGEDSFFAHYDTESRLELCAVSGSEYPLYLVPDRGDAEDVLASKYDWSEYRLPKLGKFDPKDIEIVEVEITLRLGSGEVA